MKAEKTKSRIDDVAVKEIIKSVICATCMERVKTEIAHLNREIKIAADNKIDVEFKIIKNDDNRPQITAEFWKHYVKGE